MAEAPFLSNYLYIYLFILEAVSRPLCEKIASYRESEKKILLRKSDASFSGAEIKIVWVTESVWQDAQSAVSLGCTERPLWEEFFLRPK